MYRTARKQIHFIKISKISTIDRKLKTSIVYNCTAPKYRHNKHCSNLAANWNFSYCLVHFEFSSVLFSILLVSLFLFYFFPSIVSSSLSFFPSILWSFFYLSSTSSFLSVPIWYFSYLPLHPIWYFLPLLLLPLFLSLALVLFICPAFPTSIGSFANFSTSPFFLSFPHYARQASHCNRNIGPYSCKLYIQCNEFMNLNWFEYIWLDICILWKFLSIGEWWNNTNFKLPDRFFFSLCSSCSFNLGGGIVRKRIDFKMHWFQYLSQLRNR